MLRRSETYPVAWTIAGSDPSGAAGIQADLKVFAALGVHGASVVTALTAQGLGQITAMRPSGPDFIMAQIRALADLGPPRAVKIGMVGSADASAVIASWLVEEKPFVVLDPVLATSSGGALADADTIRSIRTKLLPAVDLLTPNALEAAELSGVKISELTDVPHAALKLHRLGAKRVLIKGGHFPGDLAHDFYSDGERNFWLSSARIQGNVRGTGCTLASAIAAAVAHGHHVEDALVVAKSYLNRGLRQSYTLKTTHRLLQHGVWPVAGQDLPWISSSPSARGHAFPSCGTEPLGFYPIVDRAAWVKSFADLGVTTIQLRTKDLEGSALAREIKQAVTATIGTQTRLFINDHWQLAITAGAYGVHLGQEDLDAADTAAILRAGLRLGISTHSYFEAAVAHALRPSYLALGPIFPTTCKAMRFGPQGIARINEWHSLFPEYPLVAIGGLRLGDAADAKAAGAGGIAVIADVMKEQSPVARAAEWLTTCRSLYA